jgi:hypothetical protein
MTKLFDGTSLLHTNFNVRIPGLLETTLTNLTFDDIHQIQFYFQIPGITIKTSITPINLTEATSRRIYIPYVCSVERSGWVLVLFTDKTRQTRIIFNDLAVPRATEAALMAESFWQTLYPQLRYHHDILIDWANIHGYRTGFTSLGLSEISLGRFVMYEPLSVVDLIRSHAIIRIACQNESDLVTFRRRIQATVDTFGNSNNARAFRLGREFTTLMDIFELDDSSIGMINRQIIKIKELLADLNEAHPVIINRLTEITSLLNTNTSEQGISEIDSSSRQLSMQYLEELEGHFFLPLNFNNEK